MFAVACVWMLEVGVRAGKAAWIPSDTDVFQALERDGPTRRRFEEASWEELRGSREAEVERQSAHSKEMNAREEDEKIREAEIEEILRKRRDVSESRGKVSTSSARGRKHGFTKGWTADGDAGSRTRRSLGSRSRGRGGNRAREMDMSPPPIPTTRGILKESRSLGDIERFAGGSELIAVGKSGETGKGPQVLTREL